jgi:hypothetical protein
VRGLLGGDVMVSGEVGVEVVARDPDWRTGAAAEPVVRQVAGPDTSSD